MRRLNGEDSSFLSLEIPGQPINNLLLAIVGPAPTAGGAALSLEDVREALSERLPLLPAFRWRVQAVPGGVYHPVYADDPEFDLDHHLREHTLSGPASDDELDTFVATVAEQPLDRRHPLWQLWLIHGLEGGRDALLLKIHHCLMDGYATILMLDCLFSEHGPHPGLAPFGPAGAAPRPARLLASALRGYARALRRLPSLIKRTRLGFAAAKSEAAAGAPEPPTGKDLAICPLNLAYTSRRGYARAALPLADLKLVKDAAGVTVNDAALAVVAGSLRAYLQARAGLPEKPLIATVPVATEATAAVPRTFGNHFAALTTSLATDVPDAWQRLQVISATTAQAKRLLSLVGPDLLPAWLQLVPPAVLRRTVRWHNRKRRTDPARATANLVVSNVRGPRLPCSFAGRAIEALYAVGPPNDGVAANVALTDLGDTVCFAILTYADAVDSPQEVADGLHASLAELVRRARAAAPGLTQTPPPAPAAAHRSS